MTLDAFLLEHLPSMLGAAAEHTSRARVEIAPPLAAAHVGDQVVHFLPLELGPLAQLAGDGSDHSLGVVPHGSYPGDGIPAGRHLRELWSGMSAFAAYRMALHAALDREYKLAGAGVTRTILCRCLVQKREDVGHLLLIELRRRGAAARSAGDGPHPLVSV